MGEGRFERHGGEHWLYIQYSPPRAASLHRGGDQLIRREGREEFFGGVSGRGQPIAVRALRQDDDHALFLAGLVIVAE